LASPKVGTRKTAKAFARCGAASRWDREFESTGSWYWGQRKTVIPLAMVTVKTQISGYLMQVAFQEGQMVGKGDFLGQIDPRPYQVALELTQARWQKTGRY
jgi:multidrug resistance efflux pump